MVGDNTIHLHTIRCYCDPGRVWIVATRGTQSRIINPWPATPQEAARQIQRLREKLEAEGTCIQSR